MANTTKEQPATTGLETYGYNGDGTYHAGESFGLTDYEEYDPHTADAEAPQSDVDAEFAEMTRDLQVGGTAVNQSMKTGAIERDGEAYVGLPNSGGRRHGARKPLNK